MDFWRNGNLVYKEECILIKPNEFMPNDFMLNVRVPLQRLTTRKKNPCDSSENVCNDCFMYSSRNSSRYDCWNFPINSSWRLNRSIPIFLYFFLMISPRVTSGIFLGILLRTQIFPKVFLGIAPEIYPRTHSGIHPEIFHVITPSIPS